MKRRHRSIFFVPNFARFNRVPEEDTGGDQTGGAGTGGAAGGQKTDPPKDTVERTEYEKVMAENARLKKERDADTQKKKDEKTAALREQEKFKELAEENEKTAKQLSDENKALKTSMQESERLRAVEAACAKLGLVDKKDLDALDLSELRIETTNTGRTNVLGAEKFAERLKTLKPHWFADASKPNVNTKGTRVVDDGSDKVTIDMVIAAEKEARKTGDSTKYHELHKRLRTQR